jgi:hypothetical protein
MANLDFFLPPLAHAVAHVRLEAKAQRHHRIADADKTRKKD